MSSAAPTHPHASNGSPAIRRLVRWISRRCLGWFYREVRVLHAERIPATGAVLFIGNHPNDLPDVLLGYRATSRPLRYLATVSAATGWLSRTTYEGLGVVPVARIRDARKMQAAGVDVVAVNRDATDAVSSAFAAGHMIGAFPEGGVRDRCAMDHFRTGVASMVLKYLDAGAENDVSVVPFGLQYEAPRRFGSDVIVLVGTPFSARRWRDAQTEDSAKGAGGLTRVFHSALSEVTRNAPSWEVAEARDRLVAARAGAQSGANLSGDPLSVAADLVERAQAEVADQGDATVRLRTASDMLANSVEAAGGIATSSADHGRFLAALSGRPWPTAGARLVARLPIAAVGWLVHGPIFLAVRVLARRLAKERVDLVALSYVPGLFVIVLGYLLVAGSAAVLLASLGWSRWWAIVAFLLLPRFGDVAVQWRHELSAWRLTRRAAALPPADKAALLHAYAVVS